MKRTATFTLLAVALVATWMGCAGSDSPTPEVTTPQAGTSPSSGLMVSLRVPNMT